MRAHGGPVASHFRRRKLPRAFKSELAFRGGGSVHFDVTQPWILRGFNLELGILGLQNAPFHVGLTRADPNFTHQDVLEGLHRTSFDTKNPRMHGGRLCGQINPPMSMDISSILAGRRTLKPNGDHFSRRGYPPNWNGLITLQHHVIVEDGRKLESGQCGKKEWNHSSIVPLFPERWDGVQA